MMQIDGEHELRPLLEQIAGRATQADSDGSWPAEDLAALNDAGAMRWAVPAVYGGDDMSPMDLHARYELMAGASLATALIFTQRDAALGFIEVSENEPLKARLLPELAENRAWTTIGISHLTTSTQAGALTAKHTDDGLILNGSIPWSTGADHSDYVIAGAKVQSGDPVVFVLPTNRPGVTVRPPMKLATLSATHTSAVDCENVTIERDLLLSGPSTDAMTARKRSVHISQAFAALGLTRGALKLIKVIDHASARSTFDALTVQYQELRHAVCALNAHADGHDKQSGPLLRSELNNLALRATHAAVTLYKGSSLRIDHPAQRIAREALFLLVWSSPMSVVDRNLELLSDPH